MKKGAVISPCGTFRYSLTRSWDEGLPVCGFIMLNPSTADAELDDPTIRRCIGFAKREGCGTLIVANLFAFRATDPKELPKAQDPIGPQNDAYIDALLLHASGPVIAGWGANGFARARAKDIATRTPPGHLKCLGTSLDGSPRHPLYLPLEAPLIDYRVPA